MSERARMVLAWIDALEQRQGTILDLGWEDIIAEPLLAPGQIFLIGPPPPLPTVDELLSPRI